MEVVQAGMECIIYFWVLMECINTNVECSYKVRDAVVGIFLYTMLQIVYSRAATWKRAIGILCPVMLYCCRCSA